MNGFIDELKRRNVVRVGIAYVLLAWVIAQVAELALDSFDAPSWVIKTVLLVLALGLPIALFFSWAFELTPEGLKKEKDVDRSQSITHRTGQKLNTLIIGVLALVIAMLLADKFMLQEQEAAPQVTEEVAAPGSNSVAVLPFVDMSPAQDQEYFTDGLTENLLHALAQIRELQVAGRTSSFAFKGLNTDLRDIGQQLNVKSILEGSVQKAGDRIRITTQLINADDGYHIWSKTFDRDLSDIFSVQDEIAEAVAVALRASLLGEEVHTPTTTQNFEAYNAYLLGLSHFHKSNQDEWIKAVEQFERAIDFDPNMALAWAGLALTQSTMTGFGSDFATGFEAARESAQRAIALDPNLADGHLALASVQMTYDWDWDGAEQSLLKAASLRPGDPDIVVSLARLRSVRQKGYSPIEDIERAMELDPLNTQVARTYVAALARENRVGEAMARAEFLASATPDAGGVHYSIARMNFMQGNCDEALAIIENEKFDFLRLELQATCHGIKGNTEKAQQYLDELIERYGDDVSWQVAQVYSAWGNKDETMAALERGFAVRDPGIVYVKTAKTVSELLDGDPRYENLLRRMNLL